MPLSPSPQLNHICQTMLSESTGTKDLIFGTVTCNTLSHGFFLKEFKLTRSVFLVDRK